MNYYRFACLMLPMLAAIGCAPLEVEVSDADLKSSVLKTKSVKYFGGMTVTTVIKAEEAEFEEILPPSAQRPPAKGKIRLSEKQRQQFRKIINFIMRGELWKQKDVTVKAVDGGERTYEFQVGKHKGKFKLMNAAPKHLRPFITETQELIRSIEQAVRAKGKK